MQENSEMHSRAAAAEAAYAEMEKTLANAKESVTQNLLNPGHSTIGLEPRYLAPHHPSP